MGWALQQCVASYNVGAGKVLLCAGGHAHVVASGLKWSM